MKIWWVKTPGPGNFGDIITPHILDHFGIKYEYSSDDYDTICTGSIAKHAKPGTMVLGSGIIGMREELCPNANWLFVRGSITRNKVIMSGGKCPPIFGDPGLLLPMMCDESKKQYDVGIIPHFVDYEFVKKYYPDYNIIDILNKDPFQVVKEITKCRSIISSSLHGIICAHAYGIPAAWVKFSNKLKGDDIKFYDYYSSINMQPVLSTMDNLYFDVGIYSMSKIIDIFKSLK